MSSRDDAPGRAVERSPAGSLLARLDEIEVVVERLVAGGDGLARYEGIPIFVPRSAPGDRLRVRLTERRPDYGRAEILEVVAPGEGRREPPCPHFEACGGCDLQHLGDALQTELKVAATLETLRRLGGYEPETPPRVVAGEAWGYRLRTSWHRQGTGSDTRLGYYGSRSHRLVPIEVCPICRPEIEAALDEVTAGVAATDSRRIDVACGDGGSLTAAPPIPGVPHGEVSIEVANLRLAFDARCFFQAHRGLLDELVASAVGAWSGGTAYDLYGGVGLFALAAAPRYERVVTVEVDRMASRYARINARRNRLGNVEVVTRAVESWIGALPSAADRVIVDPPRAGLSKRVTRALIERSPRRLTYVSCHGATMARDLRKLADRFEVEVLTLLDMFPQTGHMEVVAQLTPRDGV